MNNELVRLINECLNLNNSDREINFYLFSDPRISEVCLDNSQGIFKANAVKIPGLYLPIKQVWHAYYSLREFEDNEPIGNSIEVPLEVLDRFRAGNDPDSLTLFIHYRGSKRLDVYIRESKKN
jgi:hypothetical protein